MFKYFAITSQFLLVPLNELFFILIDDLEMRSFFLLYSQNFKGFDRWPNRWSHRYSPGFGLCKSCRTSERIWTVFEFHGCIRLLSWIYNNKKLYYDRLFA